MAVNSSDYKSVIEVFDEGPSYSFYSNVEPAELTQRLRDLVLHFAEHHSDPETDEPDLDELETLTRPPGIRAISVHKEHKA